MKRLLRMLFGRRRRVVIYACEPMAAADVDRVFREWTPDERKRAVFQILQEQIEELQGEASGMGLTADQRTYLAGGVAQLEEVMAQMVERGA